jgi:serine protease Do
VGTRAVYRAALIAVVLFAAVPAFAQNGATESFQAIERQVTSLQARLISSTVNIRVGGSSGSGVIISPDGYILTAGHVTGKANRKCTVTLADNREMPGTALGVDPETDFALVKVDNAVGLPTSPLGDSNTLEPGQWLIATGHPLGRHAGRPPVLRLGRMLGYPDRERGHTLTKVVTDAPLISGDSGGPLFDLNGRVVAINVMIGGGRRDAISMHTLINLPKYALEQLKRGETLTRPLAPPAEFTDSLRQARAALAKGDNQAALASLLRCQNLDPTDAHVRFLEARAYARSRNYAAALSHLEAACSLGFNDTAGLREDSDFAPLASNPRFKQLMHRLELLAGLPGEKKRDRALMAAASHLAPAMGRGTVRLLGTDGAQIGYGIVMSANGDLLSKASELPEDGAVRCVLADGRVVPGRVKSRDPKWDVALVQAEATGLQPADFGDSCCVGQWVFTPDQDGTVMAAGVCGVADMPVKGRGIARRPTNGAFMGITMDEAEADVLKRLGLPGGIKLAKVEPDLPAGKAGLKVGDIIFQVDSEKIGDPDELADYLAGKKPGDTVTVHVGRADEKLRIDVVLGTRPAQFAVQPSLAETVSGDVSQMQGPFDDVLQHDTVLRPSAIGGPLVNLAGKCIGMNIARADRTSSYALPAKVVREIYTRLKG